MKTSVVGWFLLLGVIFSSGCFGRAFGAELPFVPPADAIVSSQTTGSDNKVWVVEFRDSVARGVVGKVKLPRHQWTKKGFRKFIRENLPDAQSYEANGIKLTLTWKKKSYVLSGKGPYYRVYARGRLDRKGYWRFGSMAGPKEAEASTSLVRMIKRLD